MRRTISILIFFIILFSNISYAYSLELEMSSSKDIIKKGDEFEIIIDWEKEMQAADLELLYDTEKVNFVNTNLEKDFFYEEDGTIKVAWFSIKSENKTSIKFKFKAISEGKTEFETRINGGFATGDLQKPSKYINRPFEVNIEESNSLLKIIIVTIIILVLIYIIIFKKKRRKK